MFCVPNIGKRYNVFIPVNKKNYIGLYQSFYKKNLFDKFRLFTLYKEFNLLLVPSDDFGCPGYVRVAYCVDADMIKRSMPAFEKLKKSYE